MTGSGAISVKQRRPPAQHKAVALALLAPATITLVAWTYWPLLESFRLSFFQWNILPSTPQLFVGLENYRRLLDLPELNTAAINTAIYTFGLLPLTILLPLAVALATQRLAGPLRNLYRGLIFLPMIMAPVVVAIIWRWLLHPDHGLINRGITAFGVDPVRFLQDPDIAIWTILFITGWKLIGFSTILIAAAIAGIDRHLSEAARLDGATEWQVTRELTLPMLSPVLLFLTMLTVLHGAQWSFVYINVLTQGGPRQATTNLYYLLWDYGFGTFAIGWATAAGMLLFALFGVAAAICMRLMSRYAVYER
ncbi:carbohydrate ABC transporter permease [Falsiroseomonas sp.]|uniref:carbohydrate ABC transporter permease n=1 Tax=Falsiroseomonas sp. TaxID=2870721 RepID=UPI0034A12F29